MNSQDSSPESTRRPENTTTSQHTNDEQHAVEDIHTLDHNNDIVDDSTTLNITSTTNAIVEGRPTLKPPQIYDIVQGQDTQKSTNQEATYDERATTKPQHDYATRGDPIPPVTPRRRRRRRTRRITPGPVPPLPQPSRQLQEAQDNNWNHLLNKYAALDIRDEQGDSAMGTTFGDHMPQDAAWPNPGHREYIRIYLINANGISYYNDYMEWEMSLGFLHDMQVDIFGITEPNLDFSQPKVKYDIMQKTRQVDRYMDLNFSTSKTNTKRNHTKTPFKMGGTITGINGGWSGRKHSSGHDPLQRWSWSSLNGQSGKILTVITTYRPCITTNDGECTIHMQQMRDLIHAGIEHPDPREELLCDLCAFILHLHEDNHTVFLLGDMNSDVQDDPRILRFLEDCGLQNVLSTRHGSIEKFPTSYDRGRRCVDIMAASKTLPPSEILRSGMLPFYYNFATDHRGFYCDVSTKWLFSKITADVTKSTMHRFTTSRVPRCERYLDKLEDLMDNSEMNASVQHLRTDMLRYINNPTGRDVEPMITRCKNLFNTMTGYMKCADKRCGSIHYPNGYAMSDKIKKSAERIFQVKHQLRRHSINGDPDDDGLLQQLKQDLRDSYKHLRNEQANSRETREEFLEALKEKRATEWKMEPCDALRIIQESERSRTKHAKHKKFMKPGMGGALRRLLVPAPCTGKVNNIRDTSQYYSVEDPEHIFDILLRRNFTQLQRSQQSIFSTGSFAEKLGHHGENEEFFAQLLRGLDNATQYDDEYPHYKGELAPFIASLKSQVQVDDTTFQWTFGTKEFIKTFRKTRESTSCGPSSLHMSHFCAATERPKIAEVHAFFIWAAFQLGFSYDRWEVSWHCMLQKMKEPYVDKLRIIQLFEGDFNAGLKYFLGKLLMQHITRQGYIDNETYGSRVGKSATEALITLQTLFAHNAIWNKTVSMMFNDAAGCFDRIPLVLAELAAVGSGCERSVMRCHTITQQHMQHYVRTAAGVSNGYIQFHTQTIITIIAMGFTIFQGIIGGIGQGGGGGPILWLMISVIMIRALRKLCTGAEMNHVLGWLRYMLWLVSYVDDNTLVKTFALGTPSTVVFTEMKKMMQHWHRLLQITGGDLCLDKCKVSVLAWTTTNYWGLPTACTITQFPGEVIMNAEKDVIQETFTLERIEPWIGERILGVRLPITGKMNEEYTYRLKQSQKMAEDLQRAPFDPFDAWMVYESRYRAAIRFPLPVTMFTTTECDSIQKPFIYQLLPKLGINRNTARAVIYGPKRMAGLELMDLRTEQPHLHYQATLGHLRRQDQAGKGILVNLSDLQAEIGSTHLIFTLDYHLYNYGNQTNRIRYLWGVLHEHECTMSGYDEWVPLPAGPGDSNIMDTAVQDPYFQSQNNYKLKVINNCRLYLGAIFISDLAQDGTIHPSKLDGTTLSINPQVQRQPRTLPPPTAWTVWKEFIFRNFLVYPYTLINPITYMHSPQPSIKQQPTEIETLTNLYTFGKGQPLQYIVQHLPTTLQSLLGTIIYPLDEGRALAQQIRDGVALGASDGSVIDKYDELYGGYAATIQQDMTAMNEFTQYAPSPHATQLSSTTTEIFGFLAATILIHVLCISHDITTGACTIYIDNREAGKAGTDDLELLNISDYLAPNYDITALLRQLITHTHVEINCEWVKSHQDELPTGERIHGPFLREVQLNQHVDELAAQGRNIAKHTITKRPVFSTTGLQLYTKSGMAIDNWGAYLVAVKNGDELKHYYLDRRGWTHTHVSQIDWEAIELCLKATPHTKRMKVLQFQHGWQNTGYQKLQFLQSALKQDEVLTEEMKLNNDVYCPFGCGEVETRMHYMNCQHEGLKAKRREFRTKMMTTLKQQHTDPMLLVLMNTWLTAMDDDEQPELRQEWSTMPHNHAIEQLYTQQTLIGWKALTQGYVALTWGSIQRHYMRHNPRTFPNPTPKQMKSDTVEVWKKKLVTELINYSISSWQFRNDQLHGALEKTSQSQRRKDLEQQVRDLYSKSNILVHENDRKMFRMPCRLRTKQYTAHLELWVDTAGQMIQKRTEMMKRGRLDHWIIQRPIAPLENRHNPIETNVRTEHDVLHSDSASGAIAVENSDSASGATAVENNASAFGASAALTGRIATGDSALGHPTDERRVTQSQ
jgi:hypothetical protein